MPNLAGGFMRETLVYEIEISDGITQACMNDQVRKNRLVLRAGGSTECSRAVKCNGTPGILQHTSCATAGAPEALFEDTPGQSLAGRNSSMFLDKLSSFTRRCRQVAGRRMKLITSQIK